MCARSIGRISRGFGVAGLVATMAWTLSGAAGAQQPTPTPLLDSRGLPLPFGVQPYYKPDVPLGSGPYKAIMSTEPGLSAHVVYAPADLAALGGRKLPVLIWGNGSCLYAGNRYRQFLTEIASYGYLVIAGGPMGPVELEVGPQSNPAPRQGGAGGRAGGAAAPAGRGAAPAGDGQALPASANETPSRVTVPLLKEGVDWAVAQNAQAGGRFAGRLDLANIVSMGHSCGSGLAVQLATEDSRITGLGVWFGGAGLVGAGGNDPSSLLKIKGSVLVVTGAAELDIAFNSGKATFDAISHVPVFYGWQDGLQHIGNFGAKNGGDMGTIARTWLEWTTRNDRTASRMFRGANCTLCRDPSWHIAKKRID